MADLNLSLEIQGTTRTAVDELGRMKAAVDQVGQSFAKQAGDAQAAGQAGTQAVAQMTDRARAANEVLRQLVERGRSFSDAFKTAQSFGGVAPTLSAADLGLQAQAARAAQVAGGGGGASNLNISPGFAALMNARSRDDEQRLNQARAQQQRQFDTLTRQQDRESQGGGGGGGALSFLERGQGVVRFAAGIVGISLGLNVAAEAARKLHDEMASAIDAERALEVGARSVAAAYGQAVLPAFQSAARAFALDPSSRGSESQFLQAAAGMQELTTAYGLNQQQVQQLIRDAGQLARIHGTDLPTAAKALQSVMQGNTSAAAAFGVTLVDEMGRLRGVGLSYQELVTISGRTTAEAVLLAKTHENIAAQQENAANTSDNLAAAFDRLGKAAELARARMGRNLTAPSVFLLTGAEQLLNPPGLTPEEQAQKRAGIVGMLSGGRGQLETGEILSATETQTRLQRAQTEGAELNARAADDARAAWINFTPAVQQSTNVAQVSATAFQRWRAEILRTTESLGRLQVVQSQFAAIARAAEGVNFPFRLESGQAAQLGAARAAQDFLAEEAQKEAANRAQAMRAHLLQNVATAEQGRYEDPRTGAMVEHSDAFGPNSDAAKRARIDLQYYDQRAAAQAKLVDAQHEQVTGEMALSVTRRQDLDNVQALANAQAEIVGHAQEQRDIAHDLNAIEDQRLQVAREADVLRARQAQLPAGRAVQDLERERQLLLAQAHLHPEERADVAGRLRDIALHGLPEAHFAELQAQGPLIAAQRAQEDTDIARQIRLGPTRLRQIDLEALLRPIQDAAARAQEAQQLTVLGTTPEEIAVERARRSAEDAQRDLYAIPSPSATATARGVGAQSVQVVVNIDASGRADASGGNAALQRAGQAAGTAGWSAFNESLATQGTPPVRPMLGGADALLEP
jgi:hypothetical protein